MIRHFRLTIGPLGKTSSVLFCGSPVRIPRGDTIGLRELSQTLATLSQIKLLATSSRTTASNQQAIESNRQPGRPSSSRTGTSLQRLTSRALERMIFFGETMLRNVVGEYLRHYHEERNHQGLANKIIQPGDEVGRCDGVIQCRERLGGLLRYYYRDAA